MPREKEVLTTRRVMGGVIMPATFAILQVDETLLPTVPQLLQVDETDSPTVPQTLETAD